MRSCGTRSRTSSSTAIAVAHRVGDLLHRRRPRLLQVVGADVDRVPARDVLDRVGDHVGDQPHRRRGRERVGPAREVLLDDVVLGRALERRPASMPVLLGGDDVERQQPRRRRVDRHRRVHLVERDAVQQRVHVALVRDRHADLADLAARELVVGVVARLRRQVERDESPVWPLARLRRYSSFDFFARSNGPRTCASSRAGRAAPVGDPYGRIWPRRRNPGARSCLQLSAAAPGGRRPVEPATIRNADRSTHRSSSWATITSSHVLELSGRIPESDLVAILKSLTATR